jgi:hypothetical protein
MAAKRLEAGPHVLAGAVGDDDDDVEHPALLVQEPDRRRL